MMACPARVDMRWRKPCFLARLRTFGWYVLFTHRLLDPDGSDCCHRSRVAVRVSQVGLLALVLA
jgi:hypothetical protein